MDSNVTALVVAIVGVLGTLSAALLTQRSYARTKQLEVANQREQREDEKQQTNLRERRDAYVALNAAAREFRRAMKNEMYDYSASPRDLESARKAFDLRNSEAQLIAHERVLVVTHSVSTKLSDAFGQLMKYQAQFAQGTHVVDEDARRALIDELDGPVAEEIRQLRKAMRQDLGVTEG
ncbi:MAG: hypothetical protein ACLPVF_14340 [Acidimicrobiales bacterium]